MIIPYVRLVLNHLWVACLAGAAVIALLAIGFVSSETFIWVGPWVWVWACPQHF